MRPQRAQRQSRQGPESKTREAAARTAPRRKKEETLTNKQTTPRDRKTVSIKWRKFNHEDSINRKHNKENQQVVVTSNDRNGVVVNEPIVWSRRGTCDRLNKRHGETSGRGEVHQCENRSSEIHAKNEAVRSTTTIVGPKSGFLQHPTATNSQYVLVLEQKINFYCTEEAQEESVDKSQPIGSTVNSQYAKADGKAKSQQQRTEFRQQE